MENRYVQEVYQLEIQHISNLFFVDRFFTKGASFMDDKNVLVAKTENKLSHYDTLQDKEIRIKQVMSDIKNKYSEYNDIMLYYKIRKEHININEIDDKRTYEYFRIVYRDEAGHLLLEERILSDEKSIQKIAEDAMKKIVSEINLLKRTSIKKERIEGIYSLVIPTSLSGFFIHEIIGHLLEDDFFQHPTTIINSDVQCSEILNISDIPQGHMNINRIDDTGIKCSKVNLIKNGKIVQCLSGKTGNKRRQDYRYEAITRMRTTYVHPYSDKDEFDYIKSLKNGIYIENITIGNLNPIDGHYTLSGYGYAISDGKKKEIIPNLCIEGNIVEDLKKIVDIGNDVKLRGVECFKKNQSVRVASLSPSMLLKDIKVTGDIYE